MPSKRKIQIAAAILLTSSMSIAAPGLASAQAIGGNERGALNRTFQGSLLKDAAGKPVMLNGKPINFNARRSMFVTNIESMSEISFSEVMETLAADARNKGLDANATRDKLFNEWWSQAAGPECNPAFNGFPYDCPRNEANENAATAFSDGDGGYRAIAAINRLDLGDPINGVCGEARLIFARHQENFNPTNRNLVIFEASIPPVAEDPATGRKLVSFEACQPYADFWLSLSDSTMSPTQRGKAIRDFFLDGVPSQGIMPVISLANFGFDKGRGQIRTNQFLSGTAPLEWTLREFKPALSGTGIRFMPQPLAGNPSPMLFSTAAGDSDTAMVSKARLYATEVIAQLGALTADDINSFGALVSAPLATGDGHSQNRQKGDVVTNFNPDGILGKRLAAAALPNNLNPSQIVSRLQLLSCGGCHNFSGANSDMGLSKNQENFWPGAPRFTHVNENTANAETIDGEAHFPISDALKETFLPFRSDVFLATYFAAGE